jgi:uncharacterized protein YqgC (DUF456 family)
MYIFIWIIIILLFILSFAGVIYPLIPSVLLLWCGFILYHFFLSEAGLSGVFWIVMIIFTLLLLFSDIIANSYFVSKFGGSATGERAAAVAVIIGSFIIPPFGILIVPFVTVVAVEMMQKRRPRQALKAAAGSLLGFLGSAISKIVIQLIMIIWFFVTI